MPTMRQKKAIELVVENHGNISKSMREAGYPEVTAKNPKNLTESKAWLELVDAGLPDDMLLEVHREGLKAERTFEGETYPDHPTRHKYLDTAYKLKGSYAPEKKVTLDVKIDATDPKAKALAEEYEEKLKLSMLE